MARPVMDSLDHRLFIGGLPKACDDSQLRAAFSTSMKRKSKKDKRRGKISASPAAQLADVAAGPQGYQLLKCYHCRQPGTEVSCSDCFRRFCWQCVSTCNRCSREQCEACCSTHDQVCRRD